MTCIYRKQASIKHNFRTVSPPLSILTYNILVRPEVKWMRNVCELKLKPSTNTPVNNNSYFFFFPSLYHHSPAIYDILHAWLVRNQRLSIPHFSFNINCFFMFFGACGKLSTTPSRLFDVSFFSVFEYLMYKSACMSVLVRYF